MNRDLSMRFVVGVMTAITTSACWDLDTAANENQERAGFRDRGQDPGDFVADETGERWNYQLRYEDVIITPDGRHLFVMVPVPGPDRGWDAPGMVLTVQELDGRRALHTFKDLMNLTRINFAPDGSAAFTLGADGRTVHRLDLQTYETKRLARLPDDQTVLDVAPDGKSLVFSNVPTTDWEEWTAQNRTCMTDGACHLTGLDLDTLKTWQLELDAPVRDLDFAPDGSLLVTRSTWDDDGVPVATLAWVAPRVGVVTAEIDFPNCADELVLRPQGDLALLGPTNCQNRINRQGADPISVIDLTTRSFVKNLPGFGPVSMSDDGSRAMGFTRKADMETQWNHHQDALVGLITIDLPSLSWWVVEYGNTEPTYLLAGHFAYVSESVTEIQDHQDGTWCSTTARALERIDLETGERVTVAGAAEAHASLQRFVRTPDDVLYMLADGRLSGMALGSATVTEVPLPARPELINIRPQGDLIVLGEADAPKFYLVSVSGPARPATLDLSQL